MLKRPRMFVASAVVAMLGALVLATPALAAPRDGETGKRDVIADAAAVCAAAALDGVANELDDACDLLAATVVPDNDRQTTALQRKAASAALSLDDYLNGGKDEQRCVAIGDLSDYIAKIAQLVAQGKLDAGTTLDDDAAAIIDALGGAGSCP